MEIGSIVEGKVTGITKFGAFISLPDGTTGMVHISEIANSFVNDIREHLTEGQTVRVKIIDIRDGRTNLSIKRTIDSSQSSQRTFTPKQHEQENGRRQFTTRRPMPYNAHEARKDFSVPNNDRITSHETSESQSFEDKLKIFMQDSDSRISDYNKHYNDRKGNRGNRNRGGKN